MLSRQLVKPRSAQSRLSRAPPAQKLMTVPSQVSSPLAASGSQASPNPQKAPVSAVW